MTQSERQSTPARPLEGQQSAPPRDAALMQEAARGDVAAFAEIYDRHAPIVLALLRRMAGGTRGEEDLLQEVFLEAWLAASDYDPTRASVRTWLLVRARSRGLDRCARRLREAQAQQVLADSESSTPHAMPQTERQIAVREGLSTLPPVMRSTLELSFFEGLTAAEIALAMNVPEGTVKSRLARGLFLMEQALSKLEEEPG